MLKRIPGLERLITALGSLITIFSAGNDYLVKHLPWLIPSVHGWARLGVLIVGVAAVAYGLWLIWSPDLRTYYGFTLRRLFPLLVGLDGHAIRLLQRMGRALLVRIVVPANGERSNWHGYLHWTNRIIDSTRLAKGGSLWKRRPVVIRRRDLERKQFWPLWEYAILLIHDPGSKLKISSTAAAGGAQFTLDLDISSEGFGIYNNDGKRFLRETYHLASDPSVQSRMERTSDALHGVLMGREAIATTAWAELLPEGALNIPLRWSSGGALPIVRDSDGKRWAALLFRDIYPIGWNVANGASEKHIEYTDLDLLINREFSEEVILGTGRLEEDNVFEQVPFAVDQSTEFIETHCQLRWHHDKLAIDILRDKRPVRPIPTPFSVQVHDGNLKRQPCRDVIFSVNAMECGIEAIKLLEFEMRRRETIMDGEILPNHELVRRPVALISLGWLKQVFDNNPDHSLGSMLTASDMPDSSQCKLLPPIPAGEIKVFLDDIQLRRRRLDRLGTRHTGKEAERLTQWLERYAESFAVVGSQCAIPGEDRFAQLRVLCPVTWKTLELAFQHKLLDPVT